MLKVVNFCETRKNMHEKTVTVRGFRLGQCILEKDGRRIKKGEKDLKPGRLR